MRRHSATVTSSARLRTVTPAALTRISTRAKAATTCSRAARTDASFVTSMASPERADATLPRRVGGLGGAIAVEVGHGDIGAVAGQARDDRAAEAPRPDDDGSPAGDVERIHGPLLVLGGQ